MRARPLLTLLLAATLIHAADGIEEKSPAADKRAVMTGDQVVTIRDETVDWYRTLGVQQQAATQPSDLLILYANRQIAEAVMALAFEIARANAELLSSEANAAQAQQTDAAAQSQAQLATQLDAARRALQAEIETGKRELATVPRAKRARSE